MEWSLLYSESATHWQEYRDCYPDDPQIQTIRSTDLSYVSGYSELTKKYSNKTLEECCKQAVALNKQKYTFIKNTIAVVADDLGEAAIIIHIGKERTGTRRVCNATGSFQYRHSFITQQGSC